MPKTKKRPQNSPDSRSQAGIWALLFLGVVVVAALLVYVRTTGTRVPADQLRTDRNVTAPSRNPGADTPTPERNEVEVLAPRYENGELKYHPTEVKVPRGTDPYLFAINSYLEQTRAIVPKNARAVRAQREGKTLVIDFNEAFRTTYGTDDERTLLDGLVNTAGQFEEVDQIVLMCAGEPLDSLGNVDLSEPLPVSHPKPGDPPNGQSTVDPKPGEPLAPSGKPSSR